MSHFVECNSEFRDPRALLAALVECGFQESQIEVPPAAVPLYGYQGDARPQQAHILIRRQHIGSGANHVGWQRLPDRTHRAWSCFAAIPPPRCSDSSAPLEAPTSLLHAAAMDPGIAVKSLGD